MIDTRPTTRIKNILCPSDLSVKSQKALGFAARLADTLEATLTACHCVPVNWFTADNRLPKEEFAAIRSALAEPICVCQNSESRLTWRKIVIENSFDPARDILNLAAESDADLIVMKARPGILSAFRFGSIVERIIAGSSCPVLLLPSHFLSTHDPSDGDLKFRRILFDSDFSEATDHLFRVANTFTRNYHSELHMLSVLEPMAYARTEMAAVGSGKMRVQKIVRERLDEVLHTEGSSARNVPTSVEWGRRVSTVIDYARAHDIDLICTTLSPPHYYFEKYYSLYLGSLLNSAGCPLLVKQSAAVDAVKNF